MGLYYIHQDTNIRIWTDLVDCVTEGLKPLTAFEIPRGLFQFKTMPFGLVNSGASFCRLIRIVLQGLHNVDSFVDDMWVFLHLGRII